MEDFTDYSDKVIGSIVAPFDGDLYLKERKLADNAFKKFPLWITYSRDAADVVATVNFARDQKLQVCGRAGGHSTAGYSMLNETVCIDVTSMNGIHVNKAEMIVEVGAGVRWGMLNHALDAYRLHTPGGSCSDVGCCGFTLGGGYGYTAMEFGMACDQLVEVTVVTADGEIVTANESENSDLFWAHRGGTGGNFGIVISLKYNIYKLKNVWPISIDWPIEDASAVITEWQNTTTKTLCDHKLGILGFLATCSVPITDKDGKRQSKLQQYFTIRGMYTGECIEDGKKALAPLLAVS